MITFKDVYFGYDKNLVLKNIQVSIPYGEFVAIIGPNGGGKTTFLNLLCGFIKPLSGSITIQPDTALRQIGYVPQINSFDKDFPLSVLDLVLGGCIGQLSWTGNYSSAQKKKAMNILKDLELDSYAKHPFGDLSGGQAQRALIARALVNDPKILILDEPTANVDKTAKAKIYSLLENLKGKMTILLVTHEIPGMIPLVDRVLCIQQTLSELDKARVCGHYAFGVYHES